MSLPSDAVCILPVSSEFLLPASGCLHLNMKTTLSLLEPTLSPGGRSEGLGGNVPPPASQSSRPPRMVAVGVCMSLWLCPAFSGITELGFTLALKFPIWAEAQRADSSCLPFLVSRSCSPTGVFLYLPNKQSVLATLSQHLLLEESKPKQMTCCVNHSQVPCEDFQCPK